VWKSSTGADAHGIPPRPQQICRRQRPWAMPSASATAPPASPHPTHLPSPTPYHGGHVTGHCAPLASSPRPSHLSPPSDLGAGHRMEVLHGRRRPWSSASTTTDRSTSMAPSEALGIGNRTTRPTTPDAPLVTHPCHGGRVAGRCAPLASPPRPSPLPPPPDLGAWHRVEVLHGRRRPCSSASTMADRSTSMASGDALSIGNCAPPPPPPPPTPPPPLVMEDASPTIVPHSLPLLAPPLYRLHWI
jgi:hypothetical protein